MYFEEGYLYHIYNQGNNKQKIFFNRYNYLFFLKKIRTHILPFADIISWCLMPNHFHLMVLINHNHRKISGSSITPKQEKSLNESIAIMLRSYTRAINNQNNRSGALFRQKTKSECINCPKGLTPSFITDNGVTVLHNDIPEREYPQVCFNYIHQNPVKAGLVSSPEEWEFSSAVDYKGIRHGSLVNQEVAQWFVNTTI